MDILNIISWVKGKRQVTTVDPTKSVIPVGIKDDRRDDGYLTGVISVADFLPAAAASLPSFLNRAAAVLAITIPNGATVGSTNLYYNQTTFAIEAVKL